VSWGILAGGRRRPMVFRIRARRGRVVSAASPYHAVHRPTAAFLGVLKAAPADLPALAAAAQRLAPLTEAVPEPWLRELERKIGTWRVGLARGAADEEAAAGVDDADDLNELQDEPAGLEDAEVVLSDDDEARLRERIAAAPDDAVALLLVGLVRGGAQVGASYLRRLFWARPLSPAAAATAAAEITGYDEDRVLLDSAVKSSDGFFTTFFVSPYSRYIARWAARRGLTPNHVTTASLFIGVLAAAAFASGERWGLVAGAVLLQVAFTTDCVDGQLARYTRTFSKLGAWLDSVFDRAKEYLAFAGLAIGSSRAGDPVWLLACCAITLQTVRHMSDFAFGGAQQHAIGASAQPPVEQPLDGAAAAAEARRNGPRPAVMAASARAQSLPERLLASWHRLDRSRAIRWIKKMVAFPIGERFAVISITAAPFTPRTTFVALLTWGGVAMLYTQAGRVLRSIR
jgi:phosphatidylglycerophosphate synthase